MTFDSGSGPLSFQTFEVPLTDDNFVEVNEDIPLQAVASKGTFSPGGGSIGTAQIIILDNDGTMHENYGLLLLPPYKV